MLSCLNNTINAKEETPEDFIKKFPNLQLDPSKTQQQMIRLNTDFRVAPKGDHSNDEGSLGYKTEPSCDAYPPHIQAILARKKYVMPDPDDIESEVLDDDTEAESGAFTLPCVEVKVDSLVDEEVAGYVPSTVSTPRSAVSTPRAKTSMVPIELPAADDPTETNEALTDSDDGSDGGGQDPEEIDICPNLPDNEDLGDGVRFSNAALTMKELQHVVDDQQKPTKSSKTQLHVHKSSVDVGQDLRGPSNPESQTTATEGMPLQLSMPNVLDKHEEHAEPREDSSGIADDDRCLLDALKLPSRAPVNKMRHLGDEEVSEADLGTGSTEKADCWEEEVQTFALDEDFDYDDRSLLTQREPLASGCVDQPFQMPLNPFPWEK